MKMWFGHPVMECRCGFETPDAEAFGQHLKKTGHLPKEAPVKKCKKTGVLPEKPKEENNGL